MQMNLHPYIRILFLVAGIIGAILCVDNSMLLLFWIAVLMPLMLITSNFKAHIKFLLIVVLPMFAMLLFVQLIVLHNIDTGFENVGNTVLKLIVYTTIIQAALIIPSDQVHSTFRMWGMKGNTLVTSLGSYIVWVDVINRSNKILTARFARGFIAERTFFTRLKQLPYLMIPLIIGIIRTATERAESWQQKKMLDRIETMQVQKVQYNFYINSALLLIVIGWLFLNAYLKWR